MVKETNKNIHIHIPSNITLALLFSIEGLCPVDFIHTQKRVCACGKAYFKILSGAKHGLMYGYIITDYTDDGNY